MLITYRKLTEKFFDKFFSNLQSICAPNYLQVTAHENQTDQEMEPNKAKNRDWLEAEYPRMTDSRTSNHTFFSEKYTYSN